MSLQRLHVFLFEARQLVPSAQLTDSRWTKLTALKPLTQAYHLESYSRRVIGWEVGRSLQVELATHHWGKDRYGVWR